MTRCPSCGSMDLQTFHRIERIPTNSCIQLATAEEARSYPTGDVELGYCRQCEFVSNLRFDPTLTEYSGRYEETQGFSTTFNRFHRSLAEDLVARHDLRGKHVVEIGCGKGEFLELICQLGENTGIGFDPGHQPSRSAETNGGRVRFVQDFFSDVYAPQRGDLICCKMTLEHISGTRDFVEMIRRSIDTVDTLVFFQVPNAGRILKECAFEDVYYEHCSYFTARSLSRLFSASGFRILDVSTAYDEQYLTLEASPAAHCDPGDAAPGELQKLVDDFPELYARKRRHWNGVIDSALSAGRRVAIWGAGSKAVSFLHTVERGAEIPIVVDINPHRRGHYMAGTAQRIVGPDDLSESAPDLVIVMNGIYEQEIREQLGRLGLRPTVCSL